MRRTLGVLVLAAGLLNGQASQKPGDAFGALRFMEGTWEAKTAGAGAGPAVAGTYTFREELGGHVLARHSSSDTCKGPADFDCEHGDLLYVYSDAAGLPLKAIYFDNEGHVIHYDVSASAGRVVFLSDGSVPGPKFRLVYELKDAVMSGKFQMQMPGQTEWKSYLEWSGAKKK